MQFKCSCGKILKVPDTMAGKQARCPGCSKVFTVPPAKKPPATAATDGKIIVTCACGKRLAAPATAAGKQVRCPACGAAVPVSAGADGGDDTFELAMPPPQTAPPKEDDYGVAALHCPNCREELETGAQFCVSCGTHLGSGAKHDEINADKVRKKQKSEKLKRVAAIARIVIPLLSFILLFWVAWVYFGRAKYEDWKKNRANNASETNAPSQTPKPPTDTSPTPPADTSPKPQPAQEPASPLSTPEKPGTLGHAPKKVGDEGYLELVVYQPSRTQDKLALASARQSIQAFKSLQGRLPKELMEAYKEYPFESAPPGTEYVYSETDGKVGLRRLRDKPAPTGDKPELD